MDIRALKLELLEEVKHILDGTDGFELSDAQLNMVNERFEAYQRGEARTYTWEEVHRMLDEECQRDQPRA